MIKEAIVKIVNKQDLSYDEAYAVMNEIMSGETTPTQNAAFLAALSTKSAKAETTDEIAGCAAAMRDHATKVDTGMDIFEIVGTGGDNAHSFNISTTSALVAAAGGMKVAKHGNRAASSQCGTADCLEALGVNIQQSPARCVELLNEVGICFFFAQKYHTSMKYVGPIRRELGFRTVFNILGPLTNPGSPAMQLLGVYDEYLVEPLAQVLISLGVKRGMVVYGKDKLDEISLSAPTKVCEIKDGWYKCYTIEPEQFGLARCTKADLGAAAHRVVFMGEEDTKRQALNVYRMRLLGAEVIPVTNGTGTLKDAVSEAMREWTSRISDTHYCLGSVMGPHPFPTIVRDFQSVISKEIKEQMLEKEGRLPDAVIACVGGGSNAIGSFYNFIEDKDVRLIGCEAAGRGIDTFETAATINTGRLGIFHGMKSYFCQDEYGQIAPVYSISAGLDYPGIGPEHAWLHDIGRAEYVAITDDEAVNAFEYLARTEGIIPAIESAHAVAHAIRLAPTMDKDQIIVITISGRGDKDCAAIARYRGEDLHE